MLGLGRALRDLGIDARVLGPCDGPPPDTFVTPLGNSIPTAANGSMAAIAPDPSASLRTIRALRDEHFDVVHLHEPLAPGPTHDRPGVQRPPLVGTFHRAGESCVVSGLSPAGRLGHQDTWRCGRPCRRRPGRRWRATLGGSYEVVWNGIDVGLYRDPPPWPTAGPTILFIGRHEPRKGLAVLIEAFAHLDR